MESLNLTKKELKLVFIAAVLVPILSFITGFAVADNTEAEVTQVIDATSTDVEVVAEQALQAIEIQQTEEEQLPAETITAVKPETPVERYIVQAGLFTVEENAKNFTCTLNKKAIDAQIMNGEKNGSPYFRVVIGTFDSQDNAKVYLEDMQKTFGINLYLSTVKMMPKSQVVATL